MSPEHQPATGAVVPDGYGPGERTAERTSGSGANEGHWIARQPVQAGFLLILVLTMGFRLAVLKDGYFITDDFMLTTRALESPFSWSYLTRVHTGHFEPVGFAVMWVFAHYAPLNWALTVSVMLTAQVVVAILMWRLLVTMFGRRPLVLVPFLLYCLTPLTVPAFTWLSAAIIWLPLTASIAGGLRQHVLYLRTGVARHAVGATLWLFFGAASFEKFLVYLPFVALLTLALRPNVALRVGAVAGLVRQTWHVWIGYVAVVVTYLAVYLPAAARSDAASSLRLPTGGQFWSFTYLTLLQTFVPVSLGGPWSWAPVSYATGIVSSPRAFDWFLWVVAAGLVVATLAVRRGIGRAWFALLGYLAFSMLTLALTRVPIVGSVAGLETRYVADAAVPLVVVAGLCIMPLRDERDIWLPIDLVPSRQMQSRLRVLLGSVLGILTFVLSLHAMNGYAVIQAANPYRNFGETARASMLTLPKDAQVFDTGMPVDVIGPLFLEYNQTSRFLSPFATREQRKSLYETTYFANPRLLMADGKLAPMTVSGVSTPAAPAQTCGWASTSGIVSIPLDGQPFPFTWAVRIGYLSDRETTATIVLGRGRRDVQLHQGLGEVFVTLEGGGSRLMLEGLDPLANVCVGDAQVGQPVPK